MNTDIVTDGQDRFAGFFIDLRDIKTETKIELDKAKIVKLFENHLAGIPGSSEDLKRCIHPSTDSQYKKGI